MQCSFCHLPIDRFAPLKSKTGRFYCSEFCADSENVPPSSRKDQTDRRYLLRLERLLALRQAQTTRT
jgi:hypothetical protein